MRNNLLLFIGIGLAFAGSLLIAGNNIVVQLGGIILGLVGVICLISYGLKSWSQKK